MLSGVLPYSGKNPRELFKQLLNTSPTPLGDAAKSVKISPTVESVVMRGLDRDLSRRYKSTAEFAHALADAINGAPKRSKGTFISNLFKRK
jgi:eukaryotic-like serine/threonine-protein kinase